MPQPSTIQTAPVPNGMLYAQPTDAEDVVSWYASFLSHPDFSSGSDLLQRVTVALLDKGTVHRDRFQIADALENMGAQLGFYSDELRVGTVGRALKRDVPDVLKLMAEQWLHPAFDEEQFNVVRMRIAANITRKLENTGYQAGVSLSRRLYPPTHPNFLPDPREELQRLEAMTVGEVRDFHRRHFSGAAFLMAVAGDLEVDVIADVLQDCLGNWPGEEQPKAIATPLERTSCTREDVVMPDKMNLDVRLGHTIEVKRNEPRYIPLYLANHILGGNSSSRLMSVIRDEMGLTYGIYSTLSGFTAQYGGHWAVKVTLSQELLEKGIEATASEIKRFVNEGVTESELADKKTTIEGAFRVQLATTQGVAGALLRGLEYDLGADYMFTYPEQVKGATLEEVNAAIPTLFAPDELQISVAGTLPAATETT